MVSHRHSASHAWLEKNKAGGARSCIPARAPAPNIPALWELWALPSQGLSSSSKTRSQFWKLQLPFSGLLMASGAESELQSSGAAAEAKARSQLVGSQRTWGRGLAASACPWMLPQSPSPLPSPKMLSQMQLFFNENAVQFILHEFLQLSAPWEPDSGGEGAMGFYEPCHLIHGVAGGWNLSSGPPGGMLSPPLP